MAKEEETPDVEEEAAPAAEAGDEDASAPDEAGEEDEVAGAEGGEAGEESAEAEGEKVAAKPKEDEGSNVAGIIEGLLKKTENENRAREQQRLDAEKVALMSPEEKRVYDLDKQIKELKTEQLRATISNADNMDRMKIQTSKYAELYKKNENEIEALVKQVRSQPGPFQFLPRETLLSYHLGLKMMNSYKGGAVSKQKAAGAERITKSTAKATTAKGQVKVNGKTDPNSAAARAERLSGVRL